MAAPRPGEWPARPVRDRPLGDGERPLGDGERPVGPIPVWPMRDDATLTDGATTVGRRFDGDGQVVAGDRTPTDGLGTLDGAAPVVPPPPPPPAFPAETTRASPFLRRPGWGLYRGPRPSTRRQKRPRGPRVVQGKRARRVVRRIDTWTVLKLSFLFYLCVLLVVLIAGIVLWNIAAALGSITSVEKFIRSLFDLSKFRFHPGVILESSVAGGIVLVLLGTGANVLAALLYNLISDVVGGVQVIVLEEQEGAPAPRS